MNSCNNYTTTGGCGCEPPCPPQPPRQPVMPCVPVCPFPPPPPRPAPPTVEPADISCGCSCAAGMAGALQLLCDARFAPLVDYTQFAFFTEHYVLGTSLSCPATSTAAYDNLTGPLAGRFVRICPSSCENLEVTGQVYYAMPVCTGTTETPCCAEGPAFDAGEVPLCALRAAAFTVPAGDDAAADYDQLKGLLWQALHPGRPPLPGTTPSMKPTPCDCSCSGLSGGSVTSVAAGPLIVGGATVLGSVGDVLVLANDTDRRIYYVCKSQIEFLS